jgi:hypothetical protein
MLFYRLCNEPVVRLYVEEKDVADDFIVRVY